MIFILSFAVFGASGVQKQFPGVRILINFFLFKDDLTYNIFFLPFI
jgi:hypothetical protein